MKQNWVILCNKDIFGYKSQEFIQIFIGDIKELKEEIDRINSQENIYVLNFKTISPSGEITTF